MKKFKSVTFLIILIASFVATTSIFAADGFYFKQVSKTPEMMGQPASESSTEQYIMDNKVRMVAGDEVTILTETDMIAINHADKSYYKTDLSFFASMAAMIDMQFADFNVTATGKTEKIGKWDTKIYKASLSMMGQTMEMSFNICSDIGYPVDMIYRQQMNMFPNAKNLQNMVKKMKELDGFPVKTTVSVMGFSTVTEVVEVKKMSMSKSDFEIPSGYKKIDAPSNPMEMMQKMK